MANNSMCWGDLLLQLGVVVKHIHNYGTHYESASYEFDFAERVPQELLDFLQPVLNKDGEHGA